MKIALFDLDKTLLSIDCEKSLFLFLKKKKIVSKKILNDNEKFYKDYENGVLNIELYTEFFVRNIVYNINKKIISKFINSIKNMYIKEMMNILKLHKKKKHKCIITTSSYKKISNPICKKIFNIKDILSNDFVRKDNVIKPKIKGIPNIGYGKVKNFKIWKKKNEIKKCKTFFYSDSINDLPFLNYSDYPYAVNPDKKLLCELKKNKKIKLLIF
ncbi:HAD-IB family phosphatase [Candidatus Vidania fulgoroideae]|uniref:HAD-IB family phosphatase n=1 Tax=Candidatus Vidania fulgoroideorum TaxID=881286 RepID=A0AAX3N951_9PROT|nr:HAD-IB family phosphatase [Candidatus Vidania fulgoroideae]